MDQQHDFDVIGVGAGFSGLYLIHKMRQIGRSVRVFEAGSGIGGTWFWNRYPGARCDVESMEYSFGFDPALEQEWSWTERYSSQPEILAYLNHVADRFDLRRDIQLETRVLAAHYCDDEADEDFGLWKVRTSDGECWRARNFVTAVGCLSSTHVPDFPGLDDFSGEVHHTSRWPHEGVDFKGKRVAVIGTGSSAIQAIPIIAEECARLTVFQRTPNYSVPAWNGPLDPETQREIKARYREVRAANRNMFTGFGGSLPHTPGFCASELDPGQQRALLEEYWKAGGLLFIGAFSDLLSDPQANQIASEFVRDKIRQVVKDPATAELLTPEHGVACKRPCADTGYFETYNREDVELVDVSGCGIERITPRGVRAGGREVEVDAIVLATGFDAMTGALNAIDIRGRGGKALSEKWAAGPITYLGLGSAGFPNLFIITGPGSPSVLTNMITSIEQHVEWIADCLRYMQQQGHAWVEPTEEAESDWVEHVNEVASGYVYPTCNSWYLGANVPGKPRVFMPHVGFPAYRERCEQVVASGYAGFRFSR
jgi:cation diffusion facilitator CzcD-associated flavoprotein CzcO